MKPLRPLAFSLPAAALLVALGAGPVPAAPAQASGQTAEPDPGETAEPSSREQKALERERRIQEYLRKKEEKRAQRERSQPETPQPAPEAQAATEKAAAKPPQPERPAEVSASSAPAEPPAGPAPRPARLPGPLARAQQNVRNTSVAQDPSVQALLETIDRQEASPYQLAAFANFLADNGLVEDAIEYYKVALRLVDDDPVLWLNLGTLYRKRNQQSQAVSAYRHALSINPNYSLAHYNLGAAMDAAGKYEAAVERYKTALTLDPSLGDPAYNPQAANNELLLAVKLMLYGEQIGNTSLPLVEVPEAP